MGINKKIVGWFVKYVMLPNSVDYTSPGFVQEKISSRSKIKVPLRNVFVAEDALAEFEKNFTKKYGKKAEDMLYKTGKEFTVRYCRLEEVPDITSPNRDLVWNLFLRTYETVFSTSIHDKLDWDKKTAELTYDEFIICRKNGLGYFFIEGVVAGYWSAICHDSTIEGIQLSCKGRGDAKCIAVYGPRSELKKYKNLKRVRAAPIKTIPPEYKTLNKTVKKPAPDAASIKDLLDFKRLDYTGGQFLLNNARVMPFELTLIQMLEDNLQKEFGDKGTEILRDSTRSAISKVVSGTDTVHDVAKLLSAFGWGIPTVTSSAKEKKIFIEYFPWSEYYADSSPYFEGFVQGFLGKNVTFKYQTTSSGINVLAKVV